MKLAFHCLGAFCIFWFKFQINTEVHYVTNSQKKQNQGNHT